MYTTPISHYSGFVLLTKEQFATAVEAGEFADSLGDLGYGYPVKIDLVDPNRTVLPSNYMWKMQDATHVMWFWYKDAPSC